MIADAEVVIYRRVLQRIAAISVLDEDDRRLASMLRAIQEWSMLSRDGEYTEAERREQCRMGIRRLEQELAHE